MSATAPRLHLVQLAGGKGLRAGGEVPKQFRRTARGPLLGVSLQEFLKLPAETAEITSITITAVAARSEILAEVFENLPDTGFRTSRAEPGRTRTESTWHALRRIATEQDPRPEDLVAVHDAARPFASTDLLTSLVAAALDHGAAVPGISVPDTILQQDPGTSTARYLPRQTLVAVQTPQVFRWELLHTAHAWAAQEGVSFTDDGGLVAHRGCDPAVVPGEDGNFKVTTDGDWHRAGDLLSL